MRKVTDQKALHHYNFSFLAVTSPIQGCLFCVNSSLAGCVLSCIPPVCRIHIRDGVEGCKKTFEPCALR